MRWRLFLLVGGLAPLAGCHLAETAIFNTVNEPAVYLDEKHVTHECRAEGKRVMKELRCRQAMSEDFEDGFVDGYADALERGGEPLPPAVPPTKYRRGRFLTANGHARVHDYFAGFQQGASCAAASGQRQYLTVPVMLADPGPEQLPPVQQVPKEQCAPGAGANCPLPGTVVVPTPTPTATQAAPKAVPALAATAPPKPVPTDTVLVPPTRPLIAPPSTAPPLPPITTSATPDPAPAADGPVSPKPEPRVVVSPRPEERK